ncbi:MAG: ParA family protein [Clostridia bacterium]|nr:ParA family protein [Clostridia bacterium]
MSRIIAISNQKGGVGKTTTAVNLAAAVAEQGKRVLLVDIDPQGNATSGLGLNAGGARSVYDVLLGECPAREAVTPTRYWALSVIPSSIELAGAEIELVSMTGRETLLRGALTPLREEFDYIFIDCPPSLSLLTLNAMTAADSVLIPIQCEYYALEGVGQLMNTLQLVKKRLNPGLEIEGVVLTMLDGRTNLGLQVVQEVKKYFKSRVYGAIIPRNVRLSEAPSHGMPINAYDPRCTGADAYRRLAEQFVDWNS